MICLDLDNPFHSEILLKFAEDGWKSGIDEDFDIDAFVEDTATITLDDTPKDPS